MAEPLGAPKIADQKLSPELRRRLAQLDPDRLMHAIVLLRTDVPPGPRRRRDRQAILAQVHAAATKVRQQLAPLLEACGGRWLAERPNALGSLPVEITPRGLVELAESEHIRAVLEDQPVTALPRPAHLKRPAKPR